MTCAPATIDPCAAGANLSTGTDHYGTNDNLCSTKVTAWRAADGLSTGNDPACKQDSDNHFDLSSNNMIPLRPVNSLIRLFTSLRETILLFPPADTEPL